MSSGNGTSSSGQFLGLARELYARVVWTHKTHEKDREIWSSKVCRTRWANVALIGVTTLLATVGAMSASQIAFIAASLAGALSTAFVVYQLSFSPEQIETAHRMAAKKLLCLRDQYLVLIQEAMSGEIPIAQLQNKLEMLQREVSVVYEYAPNTSPEAYLSACAALKTKEESTFAVEEIDMLLPEALRLAVKEPSDIRNTTN